MTEEKNSTQEEVIEEKESQEKVKEESGGVNAIAILSYLSILFLVPLLVAKDDEFAQYHAKQGLTLFIFGFIGMLVGVVPIIGWLLSPFIFIALLIFAIIGIVNVLKGAKKELPIIGSFAHKFKI